MMVKNTNKKRLLAGIFALSCAFVISGCDPIESLPQSYNDAVLEKTDGTTVDLKENIMGKIYDIIGSDKNDKTLQKILNELTEKKFGTYTEIIEAYGDDTKIAEYVTNHKDFFVRENDGEGTTATENQKNRFNDFYKDIMQRLSASFYSLISSGNYNEKETGMFSEQKLYDELLKDFWDLQEVTDAPIDGWKKYYVTKEITEDNVIDPEDRSNSKYLHIDLYSNSDATKRGYIEKKLFPQILKDKLVEQYIFDNYYDTLGRSYGRKINYVQLDYDESSLEYSKYLINTFANDYIVNVATPVEEKIDFSILQKAVNGFGSVNIEAGGSTSLLSYTGGLFSYNTTEEAAYNINNGYNGYTKKDIVEITVKEGENYFTTIDGTNIFPLATSGDTTIKAFGDTKLGKLLESYSKAIRADRVGELRAEEEDMNEYTIFKTGSSLADTLKNKILEIAKSSIITDGWYTKSSAPGTLPSAIKDRLFNINVANDLDKAPEDGGYFYEYDDGTINTIGNYRFVEGDEENGLLSRVPYVRNIKGRRLVMSSKAPTYENDKNNFIYSGDGSYFICQVLEAPNAPKLKETATTNYEMAEKEQIARSIAKILSTKDTYVTKAYTKYLEGYVFSFNDSSLYDYFKSQYPDLFDDED